MTRVVAPARLHFGLLSVPAPGVTGRLFGGCGAMLASPPTVVAAERADGWSATGPHAARALAFAKMAAEPGEAWSITVEEAPPEHVGLGLGTQLGMAVARAVAGPLPVEELARRVGRGERSGVGVHGFAAGGFLLDAGKQSPGKLATPVFRADLPSDWRFVLARPAGAGEWHGGRERGAFARPRPAEQLERISEKLCRLALLGLLPAAREGDAAAFGAALTEYNRASGGLFAADQGGDYASPLVAELVARGLAAGACGAGQSSWGPTVFALAADPDRAGAVAARLGGDFEVAVSEVFVGVPPSGGTPGHHAR